MAGEQNTSFFINLDDTFFTLYGKHLSPESLKKSTSMPFKEHAQVPILVDILSRKDSHHVILSNEYPVKLHFVFLESLIQHLTNAHIPHVLRNAELIYFNLGKQTFTSAKKKALEKDFQAICQALDKSHKYLLFALSRPDFLSLNHQQSDDHFLASLFGKLIQHPKCRVILFSHPKSKHDFQHLEDQFTLVPLNKPTDADLLNLLKLQRTELENHHHVLIPEELLTLAFLLTERYLCTSNTLEQALLLLDSSAARASAMERIDSHSQFKPVVTSTILTQVLSGWTQIPATHLPLHKFKMNDFSQGLYQRVFGQEAAISLLLSEMQQAHSSLTAKSGPFSSLLFAGPKHAGKSTTARALTEQLFKQLHALYYVQQPTPSIQAITDIKLQRSSDKRYFSLSDVTKQAPYAIIVFDQVETLPAFILDGIHEIVSTGYLHDTAGNDYHFRQAIIILMTTVGANRLEEIATQGAGDTNEHELDLMQLVMNEQKNTVLSDDHRYSPQELIDEIKPALLSQLPAALCQHLRIIPFLPLNKSAIQNIIRLKLNVLGKQLDLRHGIELGYAPEVITYLANQVLAYREHDQQLDHTDKVLKQLYFSVEQAVLSQADNKNRPNQLFLQLNDTGQLLRCDWLVMASKRQHTS